MLASSIEMLAKIIKELLILEKSPYLLFLISVFLNFFFSFIFFLIS